MGEWEAEEACGAGEAAKNLDSKPPLLAFSGQLAAISMNPNRKPSPLLPLRFLPLRSHTPSPPHISPPQLSLLQLLLCLRCPRAIALFGV